MDHRTPARRTMDCLIILFNGFDSKSGPWGVMQEVYEGRKTLEKIVDVYYKGIEVPAWIPAENERVEYHDGHSGDWLGGVVQRVVVKEGLFIVYVKYNNGTPGHWVDHRISEVRKLSAVVEK
jgi:hypothetical protein